MNSFLDKDIQFNFLINSIRPKSGLEVSGSNNKHDLENVKSIMDIVMKKRQALSILSKEQIEKINKKVIRVGESK
ncbi:MAG: hypothetical protein CM15mV25_1060 [uncultured marine virus]|nr:MAG: hypothetical protein CM15mV25_1060 [uncultured marine virus]